MDAADCWAAAKYLIYAILKIARVVNAFNGTGFNFTETIFLFEQRNQHFSDAMYQMC